MNKDSEKLIIYLLENNHITNIPSVVDNIKIDNPEIALALWCNVNKFLLKGMDESSINSTTITKDAIQKWYKQLNWKEVLKNFNEDTLFWEKAFKKTSYYFIINPSFRKDFPEIVKKILDDNDRLYSLFTLTHEKDFFDLIQADQKIKEKMYGDYLFFHAKKVTNSDFKKYHTIVNDIRFVNKILKINPVYYQVLNDIDKANPEIIKLALENPANYYKIPDEVRNDYFLTWHEKFKKNIGSNQLGFFNLEQQKIIVNENIAILIPLLKNPSFKNKELFFYAMESNFTSMLKTLELETLKKLIVNNEDLKYIIPKLKKAIINYKHVGAFSLKDENIFYLASLSEETKDLLENNTHYQVSIAINSKTDLNNPIFEQYCKILIEQVDSNQIREDKAEGLMLLAKRRLSIEILKEFRYPQKNLFKFMKMDLLKKELSMTLEEKEETKKRFKL